MTRGRGVTVWRSRNRGESMKRRKTGADLGYLWQSRRGVFFGYNHETTVYAEARGVRGRPVGSGDGVDVGDLARGDWRCTRGDWRGTGGGFPLQVCCRRRARRSIVCSRDLCAVVELAATCVARNGRLARILSPRPRVPYRECSPPLC